MTTGRPYLFASSPSAGGLAERRPAECRALTWLDVRSDTDVLLARRLARQVANELGFGSGDQTRVATAVSEIARNAFMYAHGGRVEFVVEDELGAQDLVVYVRDDGPGIPDVGAVLAGTFQSETGYGVGLAGAGRLMDALDVETSPGRGTVVRLAKRLPPGTRLAREACERIASRLSSATARNPLEELTRQNRELMQALEELGTKSAELAAANTELEAFAYSVSHDLRAPLRSIRGFARALDEDQGDRLDDEGRDYLGRVRAAAERMERLIEGILTLSRIGRAHLQEGHVDLSALARMAAHVVRERYPGRTIEFSIQDGLSATGDASLLGIALENLLDNAAKYTGSRPVARVEFGSAPRQSPRDTETYCVRDNGVGFDSRKADRLFRAFERLHSAEEFEGTGIGLATVQRIIQRHNGRIWAEARPDEGATFYFTLPPAARGT